MEALPVLREAIAYCEEKSDYVSRELFEDILESEEEHVDWLEEQFDRIKTSRYSKLPARNDDRRKQQLIHYWLFRKQAMALNHGLF